jgi:RimJ/RimL family protein N-acetyltransferase
MLIAETDRLILRHLHIVDLDAMMNVFGDAEVMRYGAGVQTREWVAKWLRGCLEDYHAKCGFGLYAVVEKRSRAVVGYCGLSHFADVGGQPETEIGYRLARAQWGKGFATEAALSVRDCAFDHLGHTRLISIIDPQNTASIRVATKLGMRYEKDVMFADYDHPDHVYSMSRTEGDS